MIEAADMVLPRLGLPDRLITALPVKPTTPEEFFGTQV